MDAPDCTTVRLTQLHFLKSLHGSIAGVVHAPPEEQKAEGGKQKAAVVVCPFGSLSLLFTAFRLLPSAFFRESPYVAPVMHAVPVNIFDRTVAALKCAV